MQIHLSVKHEDWKFRFGANGVEVNKACLMYLNICKMGKVPIITLTYDY